MINGTLKNYDIHKVYQKTDIRNSGNHVYYGHFTHKICRCNGIRVGFEGE